MQLQDSVSTLSGVGEARRKVLETGGFSLVSDFLNDIPYSYEDSTDILSVQELVKKLSLVSVWEVPAEKFTLKAKLSSISKFRTKRGFSIIQATLSDTTSDKWVRAIWFNQDFILQSLKEGEEYLWYGKIKMDGGTIVFQSPKFEHYTSIDQMKKLGRVLPVYRRIKTVTTTYIQKFVQEILESVSIKEYIPKDILSAHSLVDLAVAYREVHSPEQYGKVAEGKRRIEVQELLEVKQQYQAFFTPKQLPFTQSEGDTIQNSLQEMSKNLPFALTESQSNAISEIGKTIREGSRLDSFIYGDVGSGKTIVALLTAFAFSRIGKSSILLAPTTILATQHVKSARLFAEKLGLNGSLDITHVVSGEDIPKRSVPTLYIGTHAVLFKKKLLNDPEIMFICIDEQHRFGVEQRKALDPEKVKHVVTLSATPIPRTLAKSFLGFSQSILMSGKPVGRKEIVTKVVPFDKESVTYEWIRRKVDSGESAYLVFPRVDSTDEDKKSLVEASEALSEQYFKGVATGVLYGSMKEDEKAKVMKKFADGEIKVLFSTTVIEVGVDVPQATIIAIHGAELFGLAQLHQLRGRVGRSSEQSYCFLFPSEQQSDAVEERLTYFSLHSEGMALAEYDLANRGMGTILGVEQSGISELKIATFDNLSLLREAMEVYDVLISMDIEIPSIIR